jgi:hypothetical protein
MHVSDTSVYDNNDELIQVHYALFENNPSEELLIGSFFNSDNKKYLIFHRSIEIDTNSVVRYWQHAIIVGLMSRKTDKTMKAIERYESRE